MVWRTLSQTFMRTLKIMRQKLPLHVFMSFSYLISTLIFLVTFSFIPESTNLSLYIVGRDWNIIHIPSYMILTSAIYSVLLAYYISWPRSIILSSLLATLTGVIIEVIQHFTGRTMSWDDFLLNEIGIIVAGIAIHAWGLKKSVVRFSEYR